MVELFVLLAESFSGNVILANTRGKSVSLAYKVPLPVQAHAWANFLPSNLLKETRKDTTLDPQNTLILCTVPVRCIVTGITMAPSQHDAS